MKRPDPMPEYYTPCQFCARQAVNGRCEEHQDALRRYPPCVTGDLATDERIAQRADDNYSDYLDRVDNPTRFDPSR